MRKLKVTIKSMPKILAKRGLPIKEAYFLEDIYFSEYEKLLLPVIRQHPTRVTFYKGIPIIEIPPRREANEET